MEQTCVNRPPSCRSPRSRTGMCCASRSIAAKTRLRMTESLPALLSQSASDASWLRRTGRRYRGQGHCCAKQSAQQNGKAIASKRRHPSSGVVAAFARRAPEPGDFFSSQVRAAIRFNLPLSRSNEPINLNFTGRCARIRGYNSASVIGRLDSRSKCTATSAIFLVSTPKAQTREHSVRARPSTGLFGQLPGKGGNTYAHARFSRFAVLVYDRAIFFCKTVQVSDTARRFEPIGLPVKNTLCNRTKNKANSLG